LLAVALALIVHKIPDGFVLSAVLSASRSNASFFSTVAFLAAMTPLGTPHKKLGVALLRPNFFFFFLPAPRCAARERAGGLLGYVLMGGISPQVLGFVLGFGAGTFLFITATGMRIFKTIVFHVCLHVIDHICFGELNNVM
jgi:zinc transporter ZupT